MQIRDNLKVSVCNKRFSTSSIRVPFSSHPPPRRSLSTVLLIAYRTFGRCERIFCRAHGKFPLQKNWQREDAVVGLTVSATRGSKPMDKLTKLELKAPISRWKWIFQVWKASKTRALLSVLPDDVMMMMTACFRVFIFYVRGEWKNGSNRI